MFTRLLISALLVVTSLTALAQTRYAPDLRWDAQVQATLSLVNPDHRAIEITITAYTAAGDEIGQRVVALDGRQRFSTSALGLFGNAAISSAKFESDARFAGLVQYRRSDGGGISSAPLVFADGADVYLPQIDTVAQSFTPSTALMNTGDTGGAQLQPFVTVGTTVITQTNEATAVGDFGGANQKIFLDYSDTSSSIENLAWDRVRANGAARLASVQHLFADNNQGLASLTPVRTPAREIVFGDLQTTGRNFVTLINTHTSPLPLDIYTYNIYDQELLVRIVLDPLERRVIELESTDLTDIPPQQQWMRVVPYEGGLLASYIHQSADGAGLTADAGVAFPGSLTALSTGDIDQLSLINLGDTNTRVYVTGYDDTGKRIRSHKIIRVDPKTRLDLTPAEIWGDNASAVTWIKANTVKEPIVVYGRQTQGGDFTIIPADTISSRKAERFFAEFEYFQEVSLGDQGWRSVAVNTPDRWPNIPRFIPDFWLRGTPLPGSFYAENDDVIGWGFFHVGYQSVYEGRGILRDFNNDTVLLISPFFEAPGYGPLWLSYNLRFFNPLDASPGSKFGIAYREEGSDQWHWFGVTGDLLLQQPVNLSAFWTVDRYRNEIVTTTPWYRVQSQLPTTLNGKRIQVAFYYDFVSPGDRQAPFMFMDNIRLTNQELPQATDGPAYYVYPTSLDFRQFGSGSFTYDPDATEEE